MQKYTLRAPTPAGEILAEEFLNPLGLSQSAFARHIGWSHSKLNEIIQGKRGISPETAMVFADALGTTAQFWLNAQLAMDLWNARQNHKKYHAYHNLKRHQLDMDITIYGAGAIGLDLGVHLIEAGHKVTFIARHETLEALKKDGIKHESVSGQKRYIKPTDYTVRSEQEKAVAQDLVFLTTKVDSLLEISSHLPPLLKESTIVISATNGIPPWYSYLQANTIGRFVKNIEPREIFLRNINEKKNNRRYC